MKMSPPHRSGFTYLEMLIVVLILGITASLALGTFSRVEGAQRLTRAAREVITALRYARAMSMSTGVSYGLQIDTTNKLFLVYSSATPNTPVPQSMAKSGLYSVSFSAAEISGVTMTPTPAVDGTGRTNFPYNAMGSCTTTGKVVITFGDQTSTVQIPAVGDPYIQ